MKVFLLLFLFLVFIDNIHAQYPKLIIQLKDKSGNTFSLNNPGQFLSKRAIDGRNRYKIPIDSTDLPVTQKYLNSIQAAGDVKILSTSKWLNQVLIETIDQAAINTIMSLPFVKTTTGVGYRALPSSR